MRSYPLLALGLLQFHYCYAKNSTSAIQKQSYLPISSSATNIGRYLNGRGGDNCFPTANVKCNLRSDNSKCEDIIVKPGECGVVPVQYKFKFCNTNNKLAVSLKANKTFGKIFNKKIQMNTKPLLPGECRTKKVNFKLNTCNKKMITGQLKVEGKIPIEGDDYCYAFDYYSKKITKVEAVTKPPNVELVLECYVESVKGSGIHDKACEDMEVKDFQAVTATTRRHLQESDAEDDNFLKDFLFIYKLENDSDEEVIISDVTVLFNDMEFQLVQFGDEVFVAANTDFTSDGDIVTVDLSEFGGESLIIGGSATAVGDESNLTVEVDIQTSLPIGIP